VVSTQAGLFAEHTTFWTERIRMVAGLRVDRQSNRVDALLPENGRRSDATLVSPKLALAVVPADTLETYASVGRGFHSNDARGSTAHVDPRTGDPVSPVRPLVPDLGHEFGVRWAPSAGLVPSAAAWWLAIDSELVFVGDAGITEPSRASPRPASTTDTCIRPSHGPSGCRCAWDSERAPARWAGPRSVRHRSVTRSQVTTKRAPPEGAAWQAIRQPCPFAISLHNASPSPAPARR
jgi:hypothetical protein